MFDAVASWAVYIATLPFVNWVRVYRQSSSEVWRHSFYIEYYLDGYHDKWQGPLEDWELEPFCQYLTDIGYIMTTDEESEIYRREIDNEALRLFLKYHRDTIRNKYGKGQHDAVA